MSFLITETVWGEYKKNIFQIQGKRPISFVSLLSVRDRTKVKILGVMVMAAVGAPEDRRSLGIRISILQFTEAASF